MLTITQVTVSDDEEFRDFQSNELSGYAYSITLQYQAEIKKEDLADQPKLVRLTRSNSAEEICSGDIKQKDRSAVEQRLSKSVKELNPAAPVTPRE